MFPIIHIGFLHISSYSVMVFIGLIAFTVTTIILLEKFEKVPQATTNRLLIISIFGFIALAISALVMNSLFHSIEKGQIIIGGITWLGGVLGAFPIMILLIHKFCPSVKGEALEYFNIMLPGIVLAHAFGRIGCFLGGCCYGTVTDSALGVSFPEGSNAAKQYPGIAGRSLPVLPVQLFEAVFEILLFIAMLLLFKKAKKHFLELYAFSYGTFRFILEFTRGDSRGSIGLPISPSQFMSILLIVGGTIVLLYNKNIVFKKIYKKMQSYKEHRSAYSIKHNNVYDDIRELNQLYTEGILTKEEFETKKAELLQRI